MSETSTLKRFRTILWGLVVVAAIGATALYFLRPPASPLAVTGQPFSLQSTEGGRFTEASLRGTPSLVFFGYTHCPDVCPTTLAESVGWREQLGLKPNQLRTIFVTVDPERDTGEVLKGYLSAFDSSVIGLYGTVEETEAAKAAFGAFSEKAGEDEFYLVNHTASVFLIGGDGSFRGTIAWEENRDAALAKIKRLTGA
jgi:protein SCO1/2